MHEKIKTISETSQ